MVEKTLPEVIADLENVDASLPHLERAADDAQRELSRARTIRANLVLSYTRLSKEKGYVEQRERGNPVG